MGGTGFAAANKAGTGDRLRWGSAKKLSFMEESAHSPYRESSSMSHLVSVVDYENLPFEQVLEDMSGKDWKLISIMMQKRCEDKERKNLSSYFNKVWLEEQEQRRHYEKALADDYNRYIANKQLRDRRTHELRRQARENEEKWLREQMKSYLESKDKRYQCLREQLRDSKATYLAAKALNEELRAKEVADRRQRSMTVDKINRNLELNNIEHRLEEANCRRNALLKDLAQRTAINNALNEWESEIMARENAAADFARRAKTAARIAMVDAKCAEIAEARNWRIKRAKRIACVSALLRDYVKCNY